MQTLINVNQIHTIEMNEDENTIKFILLNGVRYIETYDSKTLFNGRVDVLMNMTRPLLYTNGKRI